MNRLFLIAVLLVYVLAAGPAEWLRMHGHVSSETVRTVFAPLVWLIDTELIPEWLVAWIRWWMP